MARVRLGDWVTCVGERPVSDGGVTGIVTRVARDGSWASVRWRVGASEWSKRMPTSSLRVEHTLRLPDGSSVTDVTREAELAAEGEGGAG